MCLRRNEITDENRGPARVTAAVMNITARDRHMNPWGRHYKDTFPLDMKPVRPYSRGVQTAFHIQRT
jgi:hypothetical protein